MTVVKNARVSLILGVRISTCARCATSWMGSLPAVFMPRTSAWFKRVAVFDVFETNPLRVG